MVAHSLAPVRFRHPAAPRAGSAKRTLCYHSGMRCTCLVLLAILSTALAPAQTKNIDDTHCTISVPTDWVGSTAGGTGAQAPDRSMSVVIRGFKTSEVPFVVNGLKQMRAAVVEDNASRVLLDVPLFGGRKQWVQITKTSPLACRATVTYLAARADAARKIAESVKPLK